MKLCSRVDPTGNTKGEIISLILEGSRTKNKPLVEGVDEGNKMDLLWELIKEIV
jgi:hypothetical protein